MTYTIEQKVTCLKREIALRERVYYKMVRTGSMRSEDSEHEIGVMKAILLDYQEQLLPRFPTMAMPTASADIDEAV